MVCSSDDFLVKQAWVRVKLAERMTMTGSYLYLGESLKHQMCTILQFLLVTLTYIVVMFTEAARYHCNN